MCGRFSLAVAETDISHQFAIEKVALNLPRYNIAPSQDILAIRATGAGRQGVLMRWGLIPGWVKNLDDWVSNLINARAETILTKPTFKNAFKARPCLIPASGFYEWCDKQPYYFQTKDRLLALAGIWETWVNPQTSEEILSCTILTRFAQGVIASIHHRMPVIIEPDDYELWLNDYEGRKQLLQGLPEIPLKMSPVHKTVNNPRNDSPDCLAPLS